MNPSVLIVEDEPLIADDLSFHLMDMGIKDVDIALKYETAINQLGNKSYNLALLDINLSSGSSLTEGRDGIDVARFINGQQKIPFIFITSYYDERTLARAKEMGPAAYILKPFDKSDIQVNVELALHKNEIATPTGPDKFFIRDKDGLISIDPEEIDFVEALDNYARVMVGENSYVISHTLKSIEDKLKTYGFERVHKSFLVNFARISMISEGYVYFGQNKIPIGRAYKTAFMSRIRTL